MLHRNRPRRGPPPHARGRPPRPRATARDPAPPDRAPRSPGWIHPAGTPRPPDRESVAPAAHHRHPARRATSASRIDLLRPGEARSTAHAPRPRPPDHPWAGVREVHPTGPPPDVGRDPSGGGGRRRPRAGPSARALWRRTRRGVTAIDRGSGPGTASTRSSAGPPDRGSGPGRPALWSAATGPPDRGSGPGRRAPGEDTRRRGERPPARWAVTGQIHMPPGAAASGTIRSGTARDGPPRARGDQMKQGRARGWAPARAAHPRSDRGEAWVTGRPRHRSAASARRQYKAVRVDRLREVACDLRTFME